MLGIGGRTIAEAKRRLTVPEFLAWIAYRRKRGSLHLGLRGDRQAALLLRYFLGWCGVKGINEYDLMPYEDAPEPVMPDLSEALKHWM